MSSFLYGPVIAWQKRMRFLAGARQVSDVHGDKKGLKSRMQNHSTSEMTFYIFSALQRKNGENLKQIFPEKEYRGLSPNLHIHVSVSELYIPTMGLPFLLEEICGPILGI
jgi:hypothetical protein